MPWGAISAYVVAAVGVPGWWWAVRWLEGWSARGEMERRAREHDDAEHAVFFENLDQRTFLERHQDAVRWLLDERRAAEARLARIDARLLGREIPGPDAL